jgi:hypothetical protein
MVTAWDGQIAEASRRFNVPEPYIRAVMQTESSGNPNAVSSKGAGGLMQVMPKTYAEIAGRLGLGADRLDPGNNITAGTSYLRQLNDRYGGDWHKTLFGYNAGPGVVAQVDAGQRDYKPESKAYVDKVLAQFGKGTGMGPLFGGRAGGATDDEMTRYGQGAFGGLLNVGAPNQSDGLGTLLGVGQTPSQPPGPSVAANPVGSRIDDLIRQISQGPQEPRMGPGGYALAGASDALGQLSGVHDRKVGFGELLGAAGGGMMRGNLAAEKAGLGQRAQQFGELDSLTKVDSYQRAQASSAAKIQAAKQYAAQLRQSNDPQMQQMAAAVELDPNLMDDIIKAQAGKVWEKDSLTTQDRNARSMGLVPGTPAYNEYIRQASMPAQTNLSVGAGERQEAKDYGTQLVKEYEGIVNRSNAALEQRGQIGVAKQIAQRDVNGQELPATYAAMAGNVAAALGIPTGENSLFGALIGRISDAQSFTGVMQNLVLSKMAAQKGSQTQADAERIEKTVALLGNTPEARTFLLNMADAMASRDIDQRRFFDQWRASHNNTFDGAAEEWIKRVDSTPLFGTNPKSNLPVFFSEFMKENRAANPHLTEQQLEDIWRQKYGR